MSTGVRGKWFVERVQQAVEKLRESGDLLPFTELLPMESIQRVLAQVGRVFRDRIYTPTVTLWVFLSQVLSADHSCDDAVARLLAWRMARGEKPCSPETGSYCTARGQLPEGLFTGLVRETGRSAEEAASDDWRWQGRRVKIVDGTTLTMPDTEENQEAYPQSNTQRPGLGFPIVRLVVIFSLAVGTVLEYAVGRYHGKFTGENQLFRGVMGQLAEDDVVLGDRYYASYWDFALLSQRGVDLVTRLHQRRACDFRCGERLGPSDHLVVWRKPASRPDWLDEATYASLPDQLVIREVKIWVAVRGFRVQQYVIATSLTDAWCYSREALAELYRARWHAELDLRSLKSALQMGHLRCLSPQMIRKEIAMHLIAYNVLRRVMSEAARLHDLLPRELSFSAAKQTFAAFREQGLLRDIGNVEVYATLLTAIASHRVGQRPGRVEPRAVKRRPHPHRLLTKPRAEARNDLFAKA